MLVALKHNSIIQRLSNDYAENTDVIALDLGLRSINFLSNALLRALSIIPYLIFAKIPYTYYFPHFTNEETNVQKE